MAIAIRNVMPQIKTDTVSNGLITQDLLFVNYSYTTEKTEPPEDTLALLIHIKKKVLTSNYVAVLTVINLHRNLFLRYVKI